MKCILEIKHVRPYYRNGDRETETVIIFHSLFKTKKSIKEFIKEDLINRKCTSHKCYKFDKSETYYGWTNKTWFNEGTGTTDQETFIYNIIKA